MKTRIIRTAAIVSTLTLGAFVATSTAWAHGHKAGGHGHGAAFFKELDANGDGKIQKSEADKLAEARFQAVDTNKDGKITRAEAEAKAKVMHSKRQDQMQERLARMFERADKNKNGKIEKSESRLPGPKFDELDTNKDGALTRAELEVSRLPVHNGRAAGITRVRGAITQHRLLVADLNHRWLSITKAR